MKRLMLAAVMVLLAASAGAQEVASVRFYVVPKIGTGSSKDSFRPKYIHPIENQPPIGAYGAMDYGLEDTMLVGVNVTPTQHTTLASNLDVIAIPADLDSTIGLTALTTVQSKLEGLHVPAGWVTQANTYRQVVSAVGKLFMFMQRFEAQQLRVFFESGVTLDTRINQLTQAQRTALTDAAISMGLDVSSITGPMLIRQALKILGDQIPSFGLAGETF
jgi:hypothetical protein